MRWLFLHFQSSLGYCSEGRGRGAGIPDRHASRNGFWRCLFCEIQNAPRFLPLRAIGQRLLGRLISTLVYRYNFCLVNSKNEGVRITLFPNFNEE